MSFSLVFIFKKKNIFKLKDSVDALTKAARDRQVSELPAAAAPH